MIGSVNLQTLELEFLQDYSTNVKRYTSLEDISQTDYDLLRSSLGDLLLNSLYGIEPNQNIKKSIIVFHNSSWMLTESDYILFGGDIEKDHRKIANKKTRNLLSFTTNPLLYPELVARKLKEFS